MRKDKQKRLGNKGFSLVELIVVIAIMAVLVGLLAPSLLGNIEKSRESKDFNTLDTVYSAVKTSYGDEAGNKAAKGMTGIGGGVALSTLVADTNAFTKQVKEAVGGSVPTLASSVNSVTGATIWVSINNDKIAVWVGGAATGDAKKVASKVTDSLGNARTFIIE